MVSKFHCDVDNYNRNKNSEDNTNRQAVKAMEVTVKPARNHQQFFPSEYDKIPLIAVVSPLP
jgi:hypothetical protein